MTQQRLNYVCILNAYPDRVDNLSTDKLMHLFVNNYYRRNIFDNVRNLNSVNCNTEIVLCFSFVGFSVHIAIFITKELLNADNCVGQNKNNTMLQYLMWRVTVGLSSHIELAFMVAGHTKFGPDYGFGVFKRLYRHAEVNTV